jgi:hypothetical protein
MKMHHACFLQNSGHILLVTMQTALSGCEGARGGRPCQKQTSMGTAKQHTYWDHTPRGERDLFDNTTAFNWPCSKQSEIGTTQLTAKLLELIWLRLWLQLAKLHTNTTMQATPASTDGMHLHEHDQPIMWTTYRGTNDQKSLLQCTKNQRKKRKGSENEAASGEEVE